jgi:hypothetical protein
MKQGRGDDYISVPLTRSNSGRHKEWFYLRNDPEHALPAYTGCSIAKSQRNWADGPAKTEQEKMLKSHWAMLGRLRDTGITLAEVVGQYHARGVVPLRRRSLHLCDMTAERAPWVGTVTTPEFSSPLEVQHRVTQAIGRSTYSSPPSRMLPMLPNVGTEKIVSCLSPREVYIRPSPWNDVLEANLGVFLSLQLKCTHLVPTKVPLPEEAIFNQKKAAAEERRAVRKAQHKKRQIAKRDRNDNRTKRRKAGEAGVSSDEDPSPEPSWSGDVASTAIDWSNMSGSSSSSPPRGVEVSSSHRPQAARRDKTVGWRSRPAAPPVREDQWMTPSRATPGETGASKSQRPAPRQADPPRMSEERSPSARQINEGSERPDSDSMQRHRSRGRSSASALTSSATPAAEPSAAPRALAVATHPGQRSTGSSRTPCLQRGLRSASGRR